MPEILTVKEVAEYLKVNPVTIYRLAQDGKIPAFKVASEWRFNKISILKWIDDKENSIVRITTRRKIYEDQN